RSCIDVLGQHGQVGHAVTVEIRRNYGKRTEKNLAHGKSGGCHRKRAISCTDEKNDSIIVVIDSGNIDLAVVVEVSHRKTIKFTRNRNRASRSFRESSISVAEGDLNAIQIRES